MPLIWFIVMCGDCHDYRLSLDFTTTLFLSMITLIFCKSIFSKTTLKFSHVINNSYKRFLHNILSHLRSFGMTMLSSIFN